MKYEEIQNRKLISAYGGVGSIIETRHGAVIIDKFNEWPFFITKEANKSHNFITDERFKARLRQYFTELKELISLPENQLKQTFTPENPRNLISASYFPKWFYCTSCHSFHHIDNWKTQWKNTVTDKHKEFFNPPKCYKCYADTNKKGQFYDLEQVRFIMTSPSGNIVDVPWLHWVLRNMPVTQNENTEPNESDEGEDANQIILNLDEITIPDDIQLKYRISARFGDLKGIRIEAYSKGKMIASTTLAGIFNLRIWENQHPEIEYGKSGVQFKTVLRSSNSVYYPNISQSIYLPIENTISTSICEKIKKKHERGRSVETILEDLEDDEINLTIEVINSIIQNNFQPMINASLNEEQYRWEEYGFITSIDEKFREKDLICNRVSPVLFDSNKISSIFRVDRLKVTTTQTSFTRQKPIDKDAFLNATLEGEIQRKYTSSYRERTHYLPAYESFGEGIFVQLDIEQLGVWEQNEFVNARIEGLQRNFNNSFLGQNRTKEITPRFVLIHTLSHLIIKELEFLCGYPAASLQERLYISERMSGFLVYTVAGAEGSYGGLVSLCKTNQIGELIKSALHRAKDCSSDPICYDTDQQGQGTAGLNLAACYSCALLPETSCEEFNSFLDRWLVIDEKNGFMQ